jgi:hypothetical protein
LGLLVQKKAGNDLVLSKNINAFCGGFSLGI